MKKRRFSVGTLSDIGYVRKTNQDRILVKIGEEELGEFGVFVVADGMGGLKAGDIASEIVVKEFKYWWDNELALIIKKKKIDLDIISVELNKLIFYINEKIIKFGRTIDDRAGTTLSMLLIYRNQYIIKHVGDSRIYKINNDITMLTKDDSWVAEQVRLGIMSVEEAENHPRKNVLIRCVGIKNKLKIFGLKGEVFNDDIFLLCSDGFYNLLTKDEIFMSIKQYKAKNIQRVLEKLMDIVRSRGALDNASAILIYQNNEKKKRSFYQKIIHIVEGAKNNEK